MSSLRIALTAVCAIAAALAAAAPAQAEDWHGSGWLGTGWGRNHLFYGFRRDPIVGVYGPSNYDFDPYASYRNDRGCIRILPVTTPAGIRLRRVFVCDF